MPWYRWEGDVIRGHWAKWTSIQLRILRRLLINIREGPWRKKKSKFYTLSRSPLSLNPLTTMPWYLALGSIKSVFQTQTILNVLSSLSPSMPWFPSYALYGGFQTAEKSCLQIRLEKKFDANRGIFFSITFLKSLSAYHGVFKSSFAWFWLRVCSLNGLTSKTHFRRRSLTWPCFHSRLYSPHSPHWHALAVCLWLTGHKVLDGCSGKYVCTWVVCAEPLSLISIWKLCNFKCIWQTLHY